MRKINNVWAGLLIVLLLSSCSPQENTKICLVDARTANGVDEKYRPVNVTSVFPEGTAKVFLWFLWKDAQKNLQLVARWKYLTEDIQILDYSFVVPRREGQGSVALAMPAGKTLPPGLYRVSLELDQRELKAVSFKVEEKK